MRWKGLTHHQFAQSPHHVRLLAQLLDAHPDFGISLQIGSDAGLVFFDQATLDKVLQISLRDFANHTQPQSMSGRARSALSRTTDHLRGSQISSFMSEYCDGEIWRKCTSELTIYKSCTVFQQCHILRIHVEVSLIPAMIMIVSCRRYPSLS